MGRAYIVALWLFAVSIKNKINKFIQKTSKIISKIGKKQI